MPVLKKKANKKLRAQQKSAKRRHRQQEAEGATVDDFDEVEQMEGVPQQAANEHDGNSDADVAEAKAEAPKPKRAKKRKSGRKKRKGKPQHPALGRFKPADDSIVGALLPLLTANELRTRNLGLKKAREWLSTSAYSGVSMKAEDTLTAMATNKEHQDGGSGDDEDGNDGDDELQGLQAANPVNAQGVELEPLEMDDFLQDSDADEEREDYNQVTRRDMMKLWDGLFFHMWMSDKRGPQAELAHSMAQLLLQIRDTDLALLYASCFFAVLEGKWGGIDRWRMNKFYDLLSRVTQAFFQFSVTHQRETPGDVIEDAVAVLARGPFRCIRDPNANLGPALHIASVLMPTLSAAGAAISVPIPAPIVHEYLDLVTTVITYNPHKLLVPKIMGAFHDAATLSDLVNIETGEPRATGNPLTTASMSEEADDNEDDEEDEDEKRPKFLQLDPHHVCSSLFERASAPDLPVRRRKLLFAARRTVLTLCKRRGVNAEGPALKLQDEDEEVVDEKQGEVEQEEVEERVEDEEVVKKTRTPRKSKQKKKQQQQEEEEEKSVAVKTKGNDEDDADKVKEATQKQVKKPQQGKKQQQQKQQKPQQGKKQQQQQQQQKKKQKGSKAKVAQAANTALKSRKEVKKQQKAKKPRRKQQ